MKYEEILNYISIKENVSKEELVKYEEKKLTYKHVKGGVILVPTDFTIKE